MAGKRGDRNKVIAPSVCTGCSGGSIYSSGGNSVSYSRPVGRKRATLSLSTDRAGVWTGIPVHVEVLQTRLHRGRRKGIGDGVVVPHVCRCDRWPEGLEEGEEPSRVVVMRCGHGMEVLHLLEN